MRFIAYSLLVSFVLVSLFSLAAPLGWPFELFSHFAVQYLVGGLVLALLFAVMGRFKMVLATLALCLWQFILIAPHVDLIPYSITSPSGPWVSSLWANVQMQEGALAKTMSLAREKRARLVTLTEVPVLEESRKAEIFTGYELLTRDPRGSTMQVLLLVREDFAKSATLQTDEASLAIVEICTATEKPFCFTFAGAHPPPPVRPGWLKVRDEKLDRLTGLLADKDHVLVMGDFNATPWSPVMGRLERQSDLKRSTCGQLNFATWLSDNPLFGLPIDHVLARQGYIWTCNVGPDFGSDHRALFAQTVWMEE